MLIALATALLLPLTQQPSVQRLDDGRTLQGWRGDPQVWSVRDDAITGSTVGHAVDANTFLIWDGGEVEDFELTFEARLEGANNSGVQYRSRVIDPARWQVHGAQLDLHPQPDFTGMLYEEGLGRGIVARRGTRVVTDAQGKPMVAGGLVPAAALDLSQWRRYRIVAIGDHVLHEVDGIPTVEFVDRHPQRLQRGVLALQVHAGAPMTVQFRDLRLRRFATSTQPHWIWGEDPDRCTASRMFAVAENPRDAALIATGDNRLRVLLNGTLVLQGDEWTRPVQADVTRWLVPGANELRVEGRNDGGPAAIALSLRWTDARGRQSLVTGPDWLVHGAGGARSAGLLGAAGLPWSGELDADAFTLGEPQLAQPATQLTVADGFVAERLYTVPRTQGSWVVLAVDPQGRLYTSDERRGLYRITPAPYGQRDARTVVEHVPVDLDGAQGLCWAFDALYAVVNGRRSGLYRLRDRDGDDRLDTVERLLPLHGSGEHGPHAVLADPDGAHLILVAGNHTRLPPFTRSRIPPRWHEDLPVPAIEDPRGHANGIRAPGGWIARVKPDGTDVEILAVGLRNPYDAAFRASGELYTWDADMEWDLGLPWYRPTRILHVASGAEFGWRTGTGKWPAWYPDSVPSLLDLGEGSPTGLVFGHRLAFPEPYCDALLALDWTNGVVLAVHLFPRSAPELRGRAEPLVRGNPLAVTDAAAGADRMLYFVTGGRGTQSVLYRLSHPAGAPAFDSNPWAALNSEAVARRSGLEQFHGRVDPAAVDAAWPHLADSDPYLAYAARLALEAQPVAQWRGRALAESSTRTALPALLALVRSGDTSDVPAIHEALLRLRWQSLLPQQRPTWLRVLSLTRARHGAAASTELQQILLEAYPRADRAQRRELAMLLVAFEVPGVTAKLLPQLAFEPGDAEQLGDAIHTALMLRLVTEPWSEAQQQTYFRFFLEAARAPGGKSFLGYLRAIRREALRARPAAERAAIGRLAQLRLDVPPPFPVTQPQGPGRAWTVDDAERAVAGALRERDFAAGRNLFFATGCATCHRVRGQGGDIGPDLTTAGNTFSLRDLLLAIVEPSRDIPDRYGSSVLRLHDGTTRFGRVVERDDGDRLELHQPDPELEPESYPRNEVAAVEPSPVSQMPQGLLYALNEQELRDLIAFLLAGGDPQAACYR